MVLRLEVARALSAASGNLVIKGSNAGALLGPADRPKLTEIREYDLAVQAPPRGPVRLLAVYGGVTDAH
jgi:hypothetical protein